VKYVYNLKADLILVDIKQAVDAAMAIQPKVAIPMHTLHANPQEFKKKVEAKSDINVVPLLQIGEVYRLR